MLTAPKEVTFSVIIPAYNAEKTLARALNSVFQQSRKDWEIIVVDDGSTDGTSDLARSFCSERISLIQTKNGGAASARNKGVLSAQGKYLSFLDSDDIWMADYLDRVNAVFQSDREIGSVVGKAIKVSESLRRIRRFPIFPKKEITLRDVLLDQVWVTCSAISLTREFTNRLSTNRNLFAEYLRLSDDAELMIHAVLDGSKKIIYCPSASVLYVQSTGSLSSNPSTLAIRENHRIFSKLKISAPATYSSWRNLTAKAMFLNLSVWAFKSARLKKGLKLYRAGLCSSFHEARYLGLHLIKATLALALYFIRSLGRPSHKISKTN